MFRPYIFDRIYKRLKLTKLNYLYLYAHNLGLIKLILKSGSNQMELMHLLETKDFIETCRLMTPYNKESDYSVLSINILSVENEFNININLIRPRLCV